MDAEMAPKIEASLQRKVVHDEFQAKLDDLKIAHEHKVQKLRPRPKPAVPIPRYQYRPPGRPLGAALTEASLARDRPRGSHPDDPENTGVLPRLRELVERDHLRPPAHAVEPVPLALGTRGHVRPLTKVPARESIVYEGDEASSVDPCLSPVRGVRLTRDAAVGYRLEPGGEPLSVVSV
eukprot:TRINITY_DN306_c0_g5_i1.p4 TRINITY_DN306_c0_g5~~TRINITY_DN306_c0_g5_i1.p4  ORF type:complete len:179 (+),score=42.92 TRINITY_DN306_c0_g5_i1:673-1209(+)